MAEIMTFTSLQADLSGYLERGSVSDATAYAQIPKNINDAERDIARALKILGVQKVYTSNFAAGTSVYAKPDRWRDTVSMNYGSGTGYNSRNPIFPRSYEYCNRYWPDRSSQAAPEFYADYDFNHWLVIPTPDDAYPFETLIYEQPPFLDSTNDSNWLTIYAPDVLRFGALLKFSQFLGDDPRIQEWKESYANGLAALNGEDLQRIIDRTVSRQEA